MQKLESQNKGLEDKLLDLEARSRLNNLRLVNLPEGAEGKDTAAFLEKWIPEALGTTLQSAVVLERAHRIGQMRDARAPLRTLIMRFHNYKDKMEIMAAVRAKKEINVQRPTCTALSGPGCRTASAEKIIRPGSSGTPQSGNPARTNSPVQAIGDS